MQSIDLVNQKNNFAKTEDVASVLTWGTPESYPDPFLSIMIPTYKRPDLLKIALESALLQKGSDYRYEVVVVDNELSEGGPTETEALIRQYEDPRLLYYQNKRNIGLAGNWNRCISLARGKWVAYLHDDDLLMPEYIKRISQLLAKKKDIDGVMVLYHELHQGEEGGKVPMRPTAFKSGLYDRLSRNKLMRLRQADSILKLGNVYGAPTCGSVFRKSSLMASGGFDDALYPSFDWFYLYAFSKQYKLYRSMERLGYYRIFINTSLRDETKVAFLGHRIQFRDHVSVTTRLGSMLKQFFANEQNNAILHEEYTDHAGKQAEGFFAPGDVTVRSVRKWLYRAITQGYWRGKAAFRLIFG